MKNHFSVGCFTSAAIALWTSTVRAQITYHSQVRSVSVSFSGQTQTQSARDFGPFDTTLSIGSAIAGAQATMSSVLRPELFRASSRADGYGLPPMPSGSASSVMAVEFDLASPTMAFVELSVSGNDSPSAARLTGPGLLLQATPNLEVSQTILLAPGRYTVSGSASTFVTGNRNLAGGWDTSVTIYDVLPFSIDWWTIDSGGGPLSGGIYDLNGTIGQPDSTPRGFLAGGEFRITGGYWARDSGTPPCPADYDDGSGVGQPDGGVTIDDLLFYLEIFRLGSASADVDNGSGDGDPDGGVTIDDLLYYLFRFAEGC